MFVPASAQFCFTLRRNLKSDHKEDICLFAVCSVQFLKYLDFFVRQGNKYLMLCNPDSFRGIECCPAHDSVIYSEKDTYEMITLEMLKFSGED